jgi:hypothetical protein
LAADARLLAAIVCSPTVCLSDDRAERLNARRTHWRMGAMSTGDAAKDISLILIAKKTGYGLAPRKWRATLGQIRDLPEAQPRGA